MKNKSLYEYEHHKKSTKGTSFKNKEKALETIKIVKELEKNHQMQIILTMYYRAEYHPHKTKDMGEAQKVFKKWLEKRNVKI
jgi:hypothetical protein